MYRPLWKFPLLSSQGLDKILSRIRIATIDQKNGPYNKCHAGCISTETVITIFLNIDDSSKDDWI